MWHLIKNRGGVIIFYSKILSRQCELDNQIRALERQIEKFPEGNLICARDGKYHKWYQSNGKSRIYIPKKKRQLAERLAHKKMLQLEMRDLLQEKEALEIYLCHYQGEKHSAEKYLAEYPEYSELVWADYVPISEKLAEWQAEPFECNNKYPEQLTIKTSSGHIVRSKSEAMIDMTLFSHRIPFRYECVLKLGNKKIYPDFTIRHPKTGKMIYWEHFGLMDEPAYQQSFGKKMMLYSEHGIVPGNNLIMTFETVENPLGADVIEDMVNHYLL